MPDKTDVHVVASLTEVSIAFGDGEFISDKIAPVVPVNKQSDKYFILDATEEGKRDTDTNRAPGAEANEEDYNVTNDTYTSDDHALRGIVPDEERDNADVAIQPDIDKTEFLTRKILLRKEIALQAAMVAGITTNSNAAGNNWGDYTNGDPISNVQTAKLEVLSGVGYPANKMAIDWATWNKLRDHPDIIDRVKAGQTSGAAIATTADVAKVLDLDEILVSTAFKNSALRDATASKTALWSTDAWVFYRPPRVTLRSMTTFATFQWKAFSNGLGVKVVKWREPKRTGDMVQVHRHYDQKLVQQLAMSRITGVIT